VTARARARRRAKTHRRPAEGRPSVKASASPVRAKRRRHQAARGAALRWNPDKDDVQRSVVKLVLTLVELVRKLMERQAIRRMEQRTLTPGETEAIGAALREIERTTRDIGKMFDLTPDDLNLDLGGIKLL
jgi:Gas vesicle protein K